MTGPTSDAEVPTFWQGLGLPGLADVHIDFVPPRMLRRIWEQSSDAAERTPTIYRWSDDERVEHLRAMGVRAYTALAYADQPGMAADLNAWTLDFASRTHGCLPGGTLYPEPGVNRYTHAAIDAGARIFKIRFQVGDVSPAHAMLDAVWGVLAEVGIPVIIDDCPGQYDDVQPLSAVLRRHPRLTAIVAHLGAPDYAGFLDLVEKYDRVCLDTSLGFTPFLEDRIPFPRAHLARLRELGLRGKVLLGTDFPNLPHPYAKQLSALAELNLGEDWLRAVCWNNAANLFELS